MYSIVILKMGFFKHQMGCLSEFNCISIKQKKKETLNELIGLKCVQVAVGNCRSSSSILFYLFGGLLFHFLELGQKIRNIITSATVNF